MTRLHLQQPGGRSERLHQLLLLCEIGLQLVEGAVHDVSLWVVGDLGGGGHPALHLGDLTYGQTGSADSFGQAQ